MTSVVIVACSSIEIHREFMHEVFGEFVCRSCWAHGLWWWGWQQRWGGAGAPIDAGADTGAPTGARACANTHTSARPIACAGRLHQRHGENHL
jgi:hypothetical protein